MIDTLTSPVRVLIADDQPLERTGLALILESDDDVAVVGEAENGEMAVDLVMRTEPDVVLMDVRMPVMDGITATRIITAARPETRVIVLTTFDLDEYAFGSLRAGASAFLVKSTRPTGLVDAVKTVASGAAVAAPRLTAKLIEHYLAQDEPPIDPSPQHDPLAVLTPRELDIFTAIVHGRSNTEISADLFLAVSTVKSHVNAIFTKLALRDRVHAVILGYELGIPSRSRET